MTEEFGPYRLEHLIGRGGMGEVHRAWDMRRGRTVALKRLPASLADDPEYQAGSPRPGGLVVAFVLQLISGGVFFLGSLVGFIGASSIVAIGMTLASAAYIGCAIKALGGRNWARITLAVVNALFVVFCLVVIVYGLSDATSTTTERAGGVAILLLPAAMAVACTVPMFTRPARRYVAARQGRP
jgi:hypothetical protein